MGRLSACSAVAIGLVPHQPALPGHRSLNWKCASSTVSEDLPCSRAQRHDVVQGLVGRIEETAEIAGRLADALLVFDERNAHIAVAVLAEADTGGDRHVGLLDEELGEFKRTEAAELLGDRRPRKHRG